MGLREELVGHCTLAVMSLVGLAIYSGTYSMIYASIGVQEPVVALLEMWMTNVHVFSACGCCVLQAMFAGVFKRQKEALPHLGEMQTALFLGVACSVTILGNYCMQNGDCAGYYGAAGFPRAAAAGSVVWAWIMFVSSLGCQTWNQGVSLGFNSKEGVLATGVMVLLPLLVNEKLKQTCGWTDACDVCDTVTPVLLVFAGTLLCHGGDLWIAWQFRAWVGYGMNIVGALTVLMTSFFLPERLLAYTLTLVVFGGNSVGQEMWHAWKRSKVVVGGGGEGGFHFSLTGIKQKLGLPNGKGLLHKL
jgi:hypothetical protein